MNTCFFDFSKDYILENERVRLSPLQLDHVGELASVSEEDEIWIYFLEKGQGEKELFTYIQLAIEKRKAKQEYPFVVFDKKTNQYAGITRLYAFDPNLCVLKMGHTWYGKKFWGTGLNGNCKFLLFRFCFETVNVERVGFGVHGENLRSIQALKKIGCQKEGSLRNFLERVDGKGRTDLLLFSLLKEEWLLTVKPRVDLS